jgi:hypothetical protein
LTGDTPEPVEVSARIPGLTPISACLKRIPYKSGHFYTHIGISEKYASFNSGKGRISPLSYLAYALETNKLPKTKSTVHENNSTMDITEYFYDIF